MCGKKREVRAPLRGMFFTIAASVYMMYSIRSNGKEFFIT
jgi:hypothetical protein